MGEFFNERLANGLGERMVGLDRCQERFGCITNCGLNGGSDPSIRRVASKDRDQSSNTISGGRFRQRERQLVADLNGWIIGQGTESSINCGNVLAGSRQSNGMTSDGCIDIIQSNEQRGVIQRTHIVSIDSVK